MIHSTTATTADNTTDDEFLVLIEFTDSNEAKYSQENSNKFKVLEIENKNPVIQIGNRLYSGEYQNNIGTYLFFNQNSTSEEQDALNCSQTSTASSQQQLATTSSYSGKTYKKLILNRIYIKPKEQNIEEDQNQN
jgi:hypothetical protein